MDMGGRVGDVIVKVGYVSDVCVVFDKTRMVVYKTRKNVGSESVVALWWVYLQAKRR
jgi:hypothetical protein